MAAKTRKPKSHQKKVESSIDTFREKRGRGRIPNMPLGEVQTRGYHYTQMLEGLWDRIEASLLAAQSEDDVKAAFGGEGYSHEQQESAPLARLILQVLRERKFPKRTKPRIRFLAESL